MLKILEPNWKRASLGCFSAPLKKGLRIFKIPANGGHRADHHRRHWLASYFVRTVFPFVLEGTKKRVIGYGVTLLVTPPQAATKIIAGMAEWQKESQNGRKWKMDKN